MDFGLSRRVDQDWDHKLSGTVMSSEEKDLAIQTAENIKGVKEVTAENLRTAS